MDQPRVDLNNLLSYRLSVVSNLLSRQQFKRFSRVSTISHPEWRLLVLVNAYGPLPVKSLSRRAGLDFGQTSRLVSRLCESGLVQKKATIDARSVDLAVTAKGRALHRKLWKLAMECNDALLSDITDTQKKTFMRVLDALTASVRAGIDPSAGRC